MNWNDFRKSLKGSGLSQQEMSKKYKEMKSSLSDEIQNQPKVIIENEILSNESQKFILLSDFLDFVNLRLNRVDNKIPDKIKKEFYNKFKPNSLLKDAKKILNIRIGPGSLREETLVVEYRAEWAKNKLKEIDNH